MRRGTQSLAVIGLAFLVGATAIVMVGSSTHASVMEWVDGWDEVPTE